MPFAQRLDSLRTVPAMSSLAFVAQCGERALAEGVRVCADKLKDHPALAQGVEVLWRQATSNDVHYENEVSSLHDAVNLLIPQSEDAIRPDPVLIFTAQIVSLGFGFFFPSVEAAVLAANAGGSLVNLLSSVYEDVRRVQMEEDMWQDRAVDLLIAHGSKPISRSIFAGLEDYDRGSISQSYLDGEEV